MMVAPSGIIIANMRIVPISMHQHLWCKAHCHRSEKRYPRSVSGVSTRLAPVMIAVTKRIDRVKKGTNPVSRSTPLKILKKTNCLILSTRPRRILLMIGNVPEAVGLLTPCRMRSVSTNSSIKNDDSASVITKLTMPESGILRNKITKEIKAALHELLDVTRAAPIDVWGEEKVVRFASRVLWLFLLHAQVTLIN